MLLILFSLFIISFCDIPVHCEFPSIEGTWTLSLTEKTHNKTSVKNECVMTSVIEPTITKVFQLKAPNLAIDENGYIGTWTLIFDQGFEITIQSEKYFAYFKYEETPNAVNFTSICDQTFVGTYHRDLINPRKWGCFSGKKTSSSNFPTRTTYPREFFYPETQKIFHNDLELVNRINNDPSKTWKATTYPEWEGKELSFGRVSHPERISKSKKRHMDFFSQFRKEKMGLKKNRVNVEELPKNWDWSNISGANYVSPVRAQLMCGSCYSFATMGMYESRQRIETQNMYNPIYSPQDILDCSVYSQGCDGGMPYLVAKYSKDFGVVDEDCDPYRGQTGEFCPDKSCPLRTFAYEFHYVGGYYGAANEENMMNTIYERGPVAIAFNVFPDLKQYTSGIYTCPKQQENKAAPTPGFFPADHAVLIVGYGENDEGEKYWIVKNSWGTKWGNSGFFWIKKGVNECNIETLVVSAEIINSDMFKES